MQGSCTMDAFTRVVMPGRIPEEGRLFVTIKWDGKRLSIVGVAGPTAHGNAKGSCGQNVEDLARVATFEEGWSAEQCAMLATVWSRWHLNDMRAGSAPQEAYLREHGRAGDYTATLAKLQEAGLSPDADGYQYGHAWKVEEVPVDVLAWLAALPASTAAHPWGDR